MIPDAPEYGTSIRLFEDDKSRIRGIAGKHDAHRLRIVIKNTDFDDIPDNGIPEDVESDPRIQINSDDKGSLDKDLPGERLDVSFRNLFDAFERQYSVDLSSRSNFVPR